MEKIVEKYIIIIYQSYLNITALAERSTIMSDNKISASLVNIEMPKSIDNAITNLTDKPTNLIGATLSDIWYLVFGGIGQAAEKRKLKYGQDLEQFKLELESKINEIPESNRIESDIRIVAPALEASKYSVGCNEIRSMFSNLIAASMNKKISSNVHPSFVDIIKQLNPLEANLIKYIRSYGLRIPMICLRQVNAEDRFNNSSIFFDGVISGEGIDIVRHYGALDLDFVENIDLPVNYLCSAFDNLSRLGLIVISYDQSFVDKNRYCQFETDPLIKEMINDCQKKYNGTKIIKAKRGVCELTDYGIDFTQICM